MKRIIRLTESDLTKIVKRVIREQNEKSDADAVLQNVDVATYCSPNPPSMVSKIMNRLPENMRQEAKDFIKKFASAIKGKSIKELISMRKQIKSEMQKKEEVNEVVGTIVIGGLVLSTSLLIAIGAILLFIILIVIITNSGKGGGSCNPGWWDNL